VRYPTPYQRRTPPTGPVSPEYLRVELTNIQQTLAQMLSMFPQAATVAPGRPQEGMVRFAMAPWRPIGGTTTDGWVIFNGTAWVAIQAPS
jgi:hypothetical protein